MIHYIQFYPTLSCNLSCGFCFNRLMDQEGDFPEERIAYLTEYLQENSIKELDILGGEPTLYRPLKRLVRSALDAGIRVWISSNGTDMKTLRELSKMGAHVGISINSLDQLHTLGPAIQKDFHIKSLYRKGMDEMLHPLLALSVKDRFVLYPDAISPEQSLYKVPFYEFYNDYQETLRPLGFKPVFCEGFIPGKGLKGRCPAGEKKLTLMPDGAVYPCYLLAHRKDFCVGNIFRDSLEEMLTKRVLEFFRNFRGNNCSKRHCLLHTQCRGGCPAHALVYFGSLSGPEPRCL